MLSIKSLIIIISGYQKTHDELIELDDYEGAGWVMADITKHIKLLETAMESYIKGDINIDKDLALKAHELLKS